MSGNVTAEFPLGSYPGPAPAGLILPSAIAIATAPVETPETGRYSTNQMKSGKTKGDSDEIT